MTALLSSMFGVLVGLVMGAAIQRWGDADRATHGHKDYPPQTDVLGATLSEVQQRWVDDPLWGGHD